MNLFATVRQRPSAYLPLAMSIAAIATVIVHVSLYGTAPQEDEGTAAHIFQLLIVGEVPIVAFFAIRWLPQVPQEALAILGLQVGAVLAALAPVFYFQW